LPGGLISEVAPGSATARAGHRVGDVLLAINGRELRDVIDVQFYAADDSIVFSARRNDERLELAVRRRYSETVGLSFAAPTFDGIRRCANHYDFCFVDQMPGGLRRSLYIRDDDYRYSFLYGSYVTLTRLNEVDWERIAEQNLSPLYVSVHVTEPELRRTLLNNPMAPDIVPQLQRLIDAGIELHTQLVLQPGVNDGAHLDRSVTDLVGLYPGVLSVSVVPVGITRFHRGNCRAYTDLEMRAVFDQVSAWQDRLRRELGIGFVYLSDEWYLRLDEPVPSRAEYDGLDLTENGVGLVRRFLESASWHSRWSISEERSLTLVTGMLFAPSLRRAVAGIDRVNVAAVSNRFLGDTVTVAGLLTGEDVITQLAGCGIGDVLVLPPAMFGGPEGQSLDEMRPERIGAALERPVIVPERSY